MIKIDGSHGEGGGAIVRVALALSAMTQKPFEVHDIRKGRKEPGLKNQHLHCVKSLKQLCGAVVDGDEIGSAFLRFYPRKIKSENIHVDIGTAGSITLLLQAILMPSIFVSKGIKIGVTGGTDVAWSPSYDYFSDVFLSQLRRFAKIEPTILRRGYHPRGNGKVEIRISPKYKLNDFNDFEEFQNNLRQNIQPIDLSQQHYLIQIKGISHASNDLQKAQVAERQAQAALKVLRQEFEVPIKITTEYRGTLSTGSGITLWAVFSKNKDDIDENNPIIMGSDALGERNKRAEIVGQEAAADLIKEIGSKAPVDSHLADQILPYLALAGGSVKSSQITDHARTNIFIISQFLDDVFEIDEKEKIISVK